MNLWNFDLPRNGYVTEGVIHIGDQRLGDDAVQSIFVHDVSTPRYPALKLEIVVDINNLPSQFIWDNYEILALDVNDERKASCVITTIEQVHER